MNKDEILNDYRKASKDNDWERMHELEKKYPALDDAFNLILDESED